ncbi:hypothetical protein GCM10010403_06600 [Glycomyces rutgersensis]|uniref:Uncharacterized protein n=2 Tax=Glycomyces TaxID=58113 RepID=A0ABU2ALG2_9ACTN|nr:hypothetical protein [Glycomyces lechevalierae]
MFGPTHLRPKGKDTSRASSAAPIRPATPNRTPPRIHLFVAARLERKQSAAAKSATPQETEPHCRHERHCRYASKRANVASPAAFQVTLPPAQPCSPA